ncbi:lysine N(6)-hydroxylase/L-ornithine N(5)-oxygenase family protein [Texcoconibacillus texcoconensis]|uniref:L-lysine N6-monooxygenase MbtG n=1 Tax=Texcoconibacillus texcoconensis TaxID=1095777 RepID=A0A840QTQ1_9BACI|nr:SidA/IucD/PvdA family monooxygenase [Texcoconibacillus texcoconensis]MBB5174679.1 lysine N6-hydroxylase [Texcoconibacillus texcoconensis]
MVQNDEQQTNVYDVIGVGIGPFNLGMAALVEPVTNMKSIFFDENESFCWHPGMLIEEADLQVPFLADFVTFADPRSPYSFINYLHMHQRLYQFYFFQRFHIPRTEYNHYAQWVAEQLQNCQFGKRVVDVVDHSNEQSSYYEVVVEDTKTKSKETCRAKHLIIGTGSTPMVPEPLKDHLGNGVFHSSQYLNQIDEGVVGQSVLVVGSGQSATEIVVDLLKRQEQQSFHIYWYTRSPAFFQLESGKLGQEIFSPDYIDYFHALPFEKRKQELPNLQHLRNGVEEETLHALYDELYHRSVGGKDTHVTIRSTIDVKEISFVDGKYQVDCEQWQQEKEFNVYVDRVILATGYRPHIPNWIERLNGKIKWEDEHRFAVKRDYRLSFEDGVVHNVYMLTNLEHSHGPGATNLLLSVQRNITILNQIVGREVYPETRGTVFQSFGATTGD